MDYSLANEFNEGSSASTKIDVAMVLMVSQSDILSGYTAERAVKVRLA
jgi:hypothetical protein